MLIIWNEVLHSI